jgi:uncharacterized protein YqcC (DUF446 family)
LATSASKRYKQGMWRIEAVSSQIFIFIELPTATMEKQAPTPDLHALIGAKAMDIEEELRRLNRWQSDALPPEKFENMGAFGSNTMAFEQWLQFILIPRIQQIVDDRDEFPSGSMLATYAVRVFDGDHEAAHLQQLLDDIDQLINTPERQVQHPEVEAEKLARADTIAVGDTNIPAVLYTLAELLPQFEGDDLESQLQTYDTFLRILSPSVRPAIAVLLLKAAKSTSNPASKQRIELAARSVSQGGQAVKP